VTIPIIEDNLDSKYVIRSHAIGKRVRSAGIIRDVAADRTGSLAARIGSVEEPVFGDCFADV